MLLNSALIIIGLILLVEGGDYLVKGAVAIAERFHMSHMVIGLTIVAFGTSSPELLVSLTSALQGNSGIALGNVVGSNIANVALILGVTALIKAAPTTRQTIAIDMPSLLIASTLLILAAASGTIERWQGIVGFLLLVLFTVWQIHNSRKKEGNAEGDSENEIMGQETSQFQETSPKCSLSQFLNLSISRHLWLAIILCVVSLTALSYGADWLVQGASGIAHGLGVSDRIIGLTVVAIGTSLPELFASIMAARRGETDMAIGNIIGSNLFNILCVLSLTSAIMPIDNSWETFRSDYSWMFCLTALLWLFLFTKRRLDRWEGGVLLTAYIAYIVLTAF